MAASTCIDRRSAIALSGLDVESLSLWRGERLLFSNLAFAVRGGEAMTLEGPNGAGKTSLLRAIAGFLEPPSGTIRVRTKEGAIVATGEERAKYVGWLGHQDGLKAQLTPAEALGFFKRYYDGAAAVEDALAKVALMRIRDLPIQYLSAGQKRRLALARLILAARPLWLLDEPLSALDRSGKALASELMAAHCREGGIVVAATHESLNIHCARLSLGSSA